MLRSINSIPYILNKNLNSYCRNSTNESIRKLTENYKSKKYIPNVKMNYNVSDNDNNDKPEFNFYFLLAFLSISSMTMLFYKRIK